MSLLQEARRNIQEAAMSAKKIREVQKVSRLVQAMKSQRIEDQVQYAKQKLYLQLRSDSEELLITYGSETPDPNSFKGILGKFKSILVTPPRRELVTTLTDSEEEPVEVRITSSPLKYLQESTITVHVQGIRRFLTIPTSEEIWEGKFFGIFYCEESNSDLRGYQKVINQVKEKFEPPTQPSQPQ